MRKTAIIFFIVLWLSIILGGGFSAYRYITDNANTWEFSHPEYCINQYDRRCGDKNPWGLGFFLFMISYPFIVAFGTAAYNPFVEDLIDKWFPKT